MDQLIKKLEQLILIHLSNSTNALSFEEEIMAKRFSKLLFEIKEYNKSRDIDSLYCFADRVFKNYVTLQREILEDYTNIMFIVEKILTNELNINPENNVVVTNDEMIENVYKRIENFKKQK